MLLLYGAVTITADHVLTVRILMVYQPHGGSGSNIVGDGRPARSQSTEAMSGPAVQPFRRRHRPMQPTHTSHNRPPTNSQGFCSDACLYATLNQ